MWASFYQSVYCGDYQHCVLFYWRGIFYYVYTTVYQFSHLWTWRLFLVFDCYEWDCCEHSYVFRTSFHLQALSVSHKLDCPFSLCERLCTSDRKVSLNFRSCLDLVSAVEWFFCLFVSTEHLNTDGKNKEREVMTLGIFLKCEHTVFFY